MRIVYVLTSLGVGGAERIVVALAAQMAERGHKVTLLILRPRLTDELLTSVEVIHLDLHKNPFSFLQALWRGRRVLRESQPDLVHSHSYHANLFSRLLRLLVPGVPVLSTIHNVYEGAWRRMLAYRLTDGLSARTTAVSAAAQERFIRLRAVPRSKCSVITNAIDTDEFVPCEERRKTTRGAMGVQDEFVWLAVGRIAPAKDYPNLLRAFSLLRATNPHVQLWIAGEGDWDWLIKNSGEPIASDTAQQVRWLGLRRDIPTLLDAADGFVLSSAWEGMPLVVAEAMAMEKPVVATDVGGVRELVGAAGTVVPAANSASLAQAMLACMSQDSASRRQLGAAARARIERDFSLDARVQEWEQIYLTLLQRN